MRFIRVLASVTSPDIIQNGNSLYKGSVSEKFFFAENPPIIHHPSTPLLLYESTKQQEGNEMVLHVENLSVTYGSKKAVNNVSFHLRSGEVIGILGANGAGKSSLIEAILGINPSNAETLTILGKSPVLQRKKVFQKVGVQFQQTNFQDKITVKEAIEQFNSLYKQTMNISTLLHVFELQDKEYQLVSSLSGGERQRLAVVLALLPNPELVFLDELTTGLDTRARHLLWKQLIQLKSNGLAIVLTSHYMDEVEALCDRIIILKKGTVMFDGTITEAIQTSNKDSLEDAYLYYSGEEDIRL